MVSGVSMNSEHRAESSGIKFKGLGSREQPLPGIDPDFKFLIEIIVMKQ